MIWCAVSILCLSFSSDNKDTHSTHAHRGTETGEATKRHCEIAKTTRVASTKYAYSRDIELQVKTL